MVFNMSYGIQGDCRYTHVPAMLEMAGVPYTGSSPMGQTLALDKVITKSLLLMADVPTPKMAVMARPDDPYHGLSFPLVVKPRHESTSNGLYLVHDHEELITAVLAVTAQYRQEALVEEYIPGRELCIGVLGNAKLEILPMVELDFNGRKSRMQERDDKFHRTEDEPEKICPAPLDPVLEAKIRHIAAATFRACHCRDYARVDLRIDPEGNPYVLEINSMASLGAGGTYVQAAKNAGYTFESLVNHIVALASKRYGLVTPEKKIQMPVVAQAAIVSLPLQRNGFTPMQDSNALGMAA